MIYPRPLPRGGLIGICSPAGPVKRDRLEQAVSGLKTAGFRVKLSPSAYGREGCLSAQDSVRAQELEDLFRDPEVDAVFSSRGGTGTSRLLSRLDLSAIAGCAKPFLGFSDITALQWALWARHEYVSFTGPLAVEWDGSVSAAARDLALSVLTQEFAGDLLAGLESTSQRSVEVLRGRGEIRGVLMPGNLAIITTLLGTRWMPDLRGTILFIEDISEAPYRFDRMLFHLKNAGALDGLAGLLVGDFGWTGEDGEYESQRQSIRDATADSDYPIVVGLPYGHGKERLTLPIGVPVRVTLSERPGLHLEPLSGEASS